MNIDTKDFKEWYDAVYIGDGDTVKSIPQSIYDAGYIDYMTGYTLAHGAWIEASKRARKDWDYYQQMLKQNGFEGITDLLTKFKQLQKEIN